MTVAIARRLGLDRPGRRVPQADRLRPAWAWLVPVALFVAIYYGGYGGLSLQRLIVGLVALVLLAVLSKRPTLCLLLVIPYVTLQQVGLPLLWSLGLPGSVARQLGGLKDLLGIALVIAGVREIVATGRKLDVLDKLAIGYIAIVLAQLLFPQLFTPLIPASFSTRLLAFRYDAGYVLLFFGARHARFAPGIRERFVRMLFILAAVVVAGGLWQKFANASFNDFMFNTARVKDFAVSVMGSKPGQAARSYAPFNASPVQVGSFLVLPHYMADLLLVVFAFVLERTARAQRWRSAIVVFGLIGVTMLFSQIRADLLAAGALLCLVVLPRRGRTPVARIGIVILILVAAVVALPTVAGTRVTGGGNAEQSNKDHLGEFSLAVHLMTDHPLGIGLGNNPATADRFQLAPGKQGALTGDNSWLQVGDELGWPGIVVYTVMIIALFTQLIRKGRGDPFPNATLLAFAGIWIAGQFHHVFLSFPQAWALWAAVGLALPARSPADDSGPADAPVESGRPELAGVEGH